MPNSAARSRSWAPTTERIARNMIEHLVQCLHDNPGLFKCLLLLVIALTVLVANVVTKP